MQDGRIAQLGTPREVYEAPANRFVADFLGAVNLFAGTVAARDGDRLRIDSAEAGAALVVEHGAALARRHATSPSRCGRRRSRLPRRRPPRADNLLAGTIAAIAYRGEASTYRDRARHRQAGARRPSPNRARDGARSGAGRSASTSSGAPTRRWCSRREPARRCVVWRCPMRGSALFFLVPFLIVLKISFAEQAIGIPPYTPLSHGGNWLTTAQLSRCSSATRFMRSAYLNVDPLRRLRRRSGAAVGYPMAYAIVRAPSAWRARLLLLVILPFWTSFLIRVYAWIGLLQGQRPHQQRC